MSLLPCSVLVPLYIYPLTQETWSPLYDAIQRYPTLPFTIIVNPDSGPGEGKDPVPDERYTFEIARLNSFPNVTLVGYVRIDYCKRKINKVLHEVSHYGRWAGLRPDGKVDADFVPKIKVSSSEGETTTHEHQGGRGKPAFKPKPDFLKSLSILRDRSPFRSRSQSPSDAFRSDSDGRHQIPQDQAHTRAFLKDTAPAKSKSFSSGIVSGDPTLRRPLSMQGIFFDETPNINSPSKAAYLRTITTAVKNASGIGGAKLVIHNPGTMPDAELVDPRHPANRHDNPETQSCMVPDVTAVFEASYQEFVVPSEWTLAQLGKSTLDRERQAYIVHSVPVEQVQEVTEQLRRQAGHVFVTDLTERFYCAFDGSWPRFVEAMAMQ